MARNAARGWFTATSALSVAAGAAVLAALVWKVGLDVIQEGFVKVGWMFPVIVGLGGLRFLARACAWSLCVDPPHDLRVRNALAAVLAGDALGNATPLGPVVGEPAKVAFARAHIPAGPGLTALAIENLFYTLATAGMIAAGTLALLFAFELPGRMREYSEIAVAAIVLGIVACLMVLWRRPALVSRMLPGMGPGTRLHGQREKLRTLEQDIYSFASRHRGRVLPVALLEIAFHALGVLETHLTLWMILDSPPALLTSFIIETASRLVTVVFKFVPLQIGVAEGTLAGLTELLGLGAAPGVTYSLVRKGRMMVWAAFGAGLLIRRGITTRTVLSDTSLHAHTPES